ncbi:hypothetical protein J7M07_08775 [bacterium]|nr:hypothetical protein [bacterium]
MTAIGQKLEQSDTNNNPGEQKIEESGILRFTLHVIIGIAGWVVFGYFWVIVIKRGIGSGIPVAIVAMAVFAIFLVALTSLWIKHNIKISRRNRRRSVLAVSQQLYTLDKVGSEVEIKDIEMLKNSPLIEITVENSKKMFKSISAQTGNKG